MDPQQLILGWEAEGQELVIAWEDYNPAWTPGSPYDLGSLQTALGGLPALDKPFRMTRTALHRAEKQLMRHAAMVEDQCIAWYIAATARFPAGTVEGDLIRARVPTSYSPGGTPVPAKPTALVLMAIGSARVVADVADATGAIGYRWYVKGPGDAAFVFKQETPTSEALLLSLALGPNEIRVTGRNSGGESVPSDVATVVVT